MSTEESAPTPVPLYARVLRLRRLRVTGMASFLLVEGTIAAAILLALAELVSWWAVPLLPFLVAAVVKINDMVGTPVRATAARATAARATAARATAARATAADSRTAGAGSRSAAFDVAGPATELARARHERVPSAFDDPAVSESASGRAAVHAGRTGAERPRQRRRGSEPDGATLVEADAWPRQREADPAGGRVTRAAASDTDDARDWGRHAAPAIQRDGATTPGVQAGGLQAGTSGNGASASSPANGIAAAPGVGPDVVPTGTPGEQAPRRARVIGAAVRRSMAQSAFGTGTGTSGNVFGNSGATRAGSAGRHSVGDETAARRSRFNERRFGRSA